jgi:cytochrome c-type biogenesis protein CcmF
MMITAIGHFALVVALCVALLQSIIPLIGAQTGNTTWMNVARPAAQLQFFFVALAFGCLTYAFLTDNFSLMYVAHNSNAAMPTVYKISAVWGAHEGSLLLWALILTVWTVAVSLFSRSLPLDYVARVLGVMGLVSVGFLSFMLLTSNPFREIFPIPSQGKELNPLLQDFGLAIHPPMLYTGYVGFCVAFAFAIAALLGGRLDATWARWSRPWTTVAWMFLTLGIGLGSWWAYYELGWGGWWFWDPVENASFMPWLVGTALIHSLAVTEKRGAFKAWTVLLAIMAFSLSLLGTFLVRSGVLTSVHAFATDPVRGIYILIFLCIVIGGSLALYAWRGNQIRSVGRFALLSRESLMLVNNVLLVVVTISVLFGTLYPLFLDAVSGKKISVGPPYFNVVFIVIMIPLVVAVGFGPLTRWKTHNFRELLRSMRVPLLLTAVSLIAGLVLLQADAKGHVAMTAIGLMLAVWVVTTSVLGLVEKFKHKQFNWAQIKSLGSSYYGMWFAHMGLAVFIVGVTLVSAYQQEDDLRVARGAQIEKGGYLFQFEGVSRSQGPNYMAQRGTVIVTRDGKPLVTLYPEKRSYQSQSSMPMTEAAIDGGLFRDLYVSLGEAVGPPEKGEWIMRIYYKPFQRWIWLAALFMALGGLLAVSDRRYRRLLPQKTQSSEQIAKELTDELLGAAAQNR